MKCRDVDDYVQRILAKENDTYATAEKCDGTKVQLSDMLVDYGYAICDIQLARQHLKLLRNNGHDREAHELQEGRYEAILAYDADPTSQFPYYEYTDRDWNAYEVYFRMVHEKFKF